MEHLAKILRLIRATSSVHVCGLKNHTINQFMPQNFPIFIQNFPELQLSLYFTHKVFKKKQKPDLRNTFFKQVKGKVKGSKRTRKSISIKKGKISKSIKIKKKSLQPSETK